MKKTSFILSFCLILSAMLSISCQDYDWKASSSSVLVIYSAGANNLSDKLELNLTETSGHYLPGYYEDNKVVVVSQRLNSSGKVEAPKIYRIYRADADGQVKKDLLKEMDSSDDLCDIDACVKALDFIKKKFPSEHYSMIYSSHGTGWIPVGARIEYFWGDLSLGKSIGYSNRENELDVKEFASGIPMHFDYLILDACLMGGVEVAYQFRGIADKIVFSQSEIPSSGMDYNLMLRRLIGYSQPDLISLCMDYVDKYNDSSSLPITISCVDCSSLQGLASICSDIFFRYNLSLSPETMYFSNPYFTDFRSLLYDSGVSADDMKKVDEALSKLIVCKFCNDVVKKDKYCGLTTLNPYYKGRSFKVGTKRINVGTFYKTYDWNDATGLVK